VLNPQTQEERLLPDHLGRAGPDCEGSGPAKRPTVRSLLVTRLGRGVLEAQVLDLVWTADGPVTARELHDQLSQGRKLAYTTSMTILVRLHKKGLLERRPAGRGFAYWPKVSREEWAARRMSEALTSAGDRSLALTHFVDSLPADQVDELRNLLRGSGSDR
jgi:predicted transcriptional regulator